MGHDQRIALEVWSPLPPLGSGVADYVAEQLEFLNEAFDLRVVVDTPTEIDSALRARYRVVAPDASDPTSLRLYHVGNSPLHAFIYREAVRTPGIVVLHEWNLHELLLGFAVTTNDFDAYRAQMRREHGERGSIAAETIASALGGKHWTSVFPLNTELLERSLAIVALSASTAAKVEARRPGLPLLHLPHHSVLKAHARDRADARARLGIAQDARVVLAPGLSTSSKSLDTARAAVQAIQSRVPDATLIAVGGGDALSSNDADGVRSLGRVDIQTLGDALLGADVVLALRFPSRGETSGVLMRSLAAGRAAVVSAGSTADEDLPEGVVARVDPGPHESAELSAILEFLLIDAVARERMERLALAVAASHSAEGLTGTLCRFLMDVNRERDALNAAIGQRSAAGSRVPTRFRNEMDAVASSLGLAQLPTNVFEKLSGLL